MRQKSSQQPCYSCFQVLQNSQHRKNSQLIQFKLTKKENLPRNIYRNFKLNSHNSFRYSNHYKFEDHNLNTLQAKKQRTSLRQKLNILSQNRNHKDDYANQHNINAFQKGSKDKQRSTKAGFMKDAIVKTEPIQQERYKINCFKKKNTQKSQEDNIRIDSNSKVPSAQQKKPKRFSQFYHNNNKQRKNCQSKKNENLIFHKQKFCDKRFSLGLNKNISKLLVSVCDQKSSEQQSIVIQKNSGPRDNLNLKQQQHQVHYNFLPK